MWPYLVQILAIVGLPLWLTAMLWRRADADRLSWLLRALYSIAFVGYILLVGRWDIVSFYGRYAIGALLIAAVVVSGLHARKLRWIAPNVRARWVQYATSILCLVGFSAFFVWALSGYTYEEALDEVALRFPLSDGWLYVGQGGAAGIVNHHFRLPAQRYALDVLELNRWGVRARGVYPQELDRYVIFDKPVVSPCDGEILAAVDGLPDSIPPARDADHVAGNHIVVACNNVEVLLAHLRKGSVQVTQGTSVTSGDFVARVGNSGNTSEPHLHVHAVRAGSGGVLHGKGVPMRFEDRFLVRNASVRAHR